MCPAQNTLTCIETNNRSQISENSMALSLHLAVSCLGPCIIFLKGENVGAVKYRINYFNQLMFTNVQFPWIPLLLENVTA